MWQRMVVVVVVLAGFMVAAAPDCAVSHCVYVPGLVGSAPTATLIPTNTRTPTITPTQGLRGTKTPTPTLPPSVVRVKSYRLTPDSIGNVIAIGEIVNDTSQIVYDVQIIGKFYNASGAFVGTNSTTASLVRVLPSQTDPFRLYLMNAPAGVVRVDLTVSFSTSTILAYRPATILSAQSRDNSGVEIFGEVRNDQGNTLRSIKVVATFYDSAGGVYETDFAYADINDVPVGGTSTYKISTFRPALTGLDAIVQAEGYFPP